MLCIFPGAFVDRALVIFPPAAVVLPNAGRSFAVGATIVIVRPVQRNFIRHTFARFVFAVAFRPDAFVAAASVLIAYLIEFWRAGAIRIEVDNLDIIGDCLVKENFGTVIFINFLLARIATVSSATVVFVIFVGGGADTFIPMFNTLNQYPWTCQVMTDGAVAGIVEISADIIAVVGASVFFIRAVFTELAQASWAVSRFAGFYGIRNTQNCAGCSRRQAFAASGQIAHITIFNPAEMLWRGGRHNLRGIVLIAAEIRKAVIDDIRISASYFIN